MKAFELLMNIIERSPWNIEEVRAVLGNYNFSKEELMRVAIKTAEKYEFSEMLNEYENRKKIEVDEYGDWYMRRYMEYDPIFVEEICVHPLIKILELLLEYGLDPRVRMAEDPTNIMCVLKDIDTPFLAAMAMRLMMNHGADPYVKDESGGGTIFQEELLFPKVLYTELFTFSCGLLGCFISTSASILVLSYVYRLYICQVFFLSFYCLFF